MSFTESVFPEKDFNIINPSPAQNLLSLNDIFRESLKKAQATVDSVHTIVRCENLPQIKGNHEDVATFFDLLLSTIFNHPPAGSRLFLYVDCNEYNEKPEDSILPFGSKRYLLKFHTNVATSKSWHATNDNTIAICKQILSNLNGNLVVNNVSSTGCLFAVTLPGKFD
jgi:hypothetical protein